MTRDAGPGEERWGAMLYGELRPDTSPSWSELSVYLRSRWKRVAARLRDGDHCDGWRRDVLNAFDPPIPDGGRYRNDVIARIERLQQDARPPEVEGRTLWEMIRDAAEQYSGQPKHIASVAASEIYRAGYRRPLPPEAEGQKSALRKALEDGLYTLPDFDPHDDEAWLVDLAERAILDALARPPEAEGVDVRGPNGDKVDTALQIESEGGTRPDERWAMRVLAREVRRLRALSTPSEPGAFVCTEHATEDDESIPCAIEGCWNAATWMTPSEPREPSVAEKYRELLYEVVHKIPGETRHETARRIIRQHENQNNDPRTDSPLSEPREDTSPQTHTSLDQ